MFLASFSFAFMGGFVKILSQELPPLEVTFFRNLFGVLFIGVTFLKYPLNQKGGKFFLLFFRGFIGFLALYAYFYNIAHIPLSEAVVYNKISPIFVAIFAFIFLKEKLHRNIILSIIISFIGVLFIAQPENGVFNKYDILGIFSGIGAALAYTSIRELRKFYDTRIIVLSFMITGSVIPLLMMFLFNFDIDFLDSVSSKFIMPTEFIIWIYITGVGVFATLSQYLMTKSYEYTQAGIVSSVSYSNIIFSMIVGYFLGDVFPNIFMIFGVILIIVSGFLIIKK